MASTPAGYSAEQRVFVELLHSMGIDDFDANVPAALSEYARRFASEILCDAKDYAGHAGRQELSAEDIAVALKLYDGHLTGVDQREQVLSELRATTNKKSITDFADSSVLHHLPSNALLQRSHTYIPGLEAYGEFMDESKGKDSDQHSMDNFESMPSMASYGPGPLAESRDKVSFSQTSNGGAKPLGPSAAEFSL